MILVTAAGGKTGRAVVAALAERGAAVRALRRSGEPVPEATETVAGDVGDLAPHLSGIDAVYFIWPNFAEGEVEGVARALAAAATQRRPRFVYHSVLRPGLEAMPHHWAKMRSEELLAESDLEWVTLQPGAYLQNIELQLDAVRATGVYESPWGLEVASSLVDLADVAEVAARACLDDRMTGGAFELAGPQPLTAVDVAAALTRSLDRPVTAHDQSPAGWDDSARAAGMFDEEVRRGRLMAEHYRDHGFSGSPVVLEGLLGRPPTDLRGYLDRLRPVPARP